MLGNFIKYQEIMICLEGEAEIENIGCDKTLSVTYFGI